MGEIVTEIVIDRSIEKVWHLLVDFDGYASWNPFILNIKGKAQLGEKLAVTIKPPDGKQMVFKPKIIVFDCSGSRRELQWLGHFLAPKIFSGKHRFKLDILAKNKTQLIHSESFSGILAKPVFKKISASTELGFQQMNLALKKLSESNV